ncbi:phospholipase [Oceaniferula spumae]|uniref:Phospholipase n=1 Tax=Oceaniferula spumae TaxID=2979115 RepID=A0AAT9FKQ4_9BACT
MKSFSIILLLFLSAAVLHAQQGDEGKVHRLPDSTAKEATSLNPDYYVLGESLAAQKKLPLLILLHGAGGTGLDIRKPRGLAVKVMRTLKKAGIEALIVAPQAAKSPAVAGAKGGWVPADLNKLLTHLLATLPIDPNRVYLSGNSMGGYGTYAWAGANPEHFAAIAPIVGGLGALGPKDITPNLDQWGKNLATLPMRSYYGEKDRVVPADRGAMVLKAIEKAGGKQAKVIVLDDMGHNAGKIPLSDPDFFRWLFSHTRKKQ